LSSSKLILAPTANWKGRLEVINYCAGVVDDASRRKRDVLSVADTELDGVVDARTRRRLEAEIYADEVKVRACLAVAGKTCD